jgi:hypothetical protein
MIATQNLYPIVLQVDLHMPDALGLTANSHHLPVVAQLNASLLPSATIRLAPHLLLYFVINAAG